MNPVRELFQLMELNSEEPVMVIRPQHSGNPGWGKFRYYYQVDFSPANEAGHYYLRGQNSGIRSQSFQIGDGAYRGIQEELLGFMRQQRCGYNPFLDMVCHQRDGRSAYGNMPDSTWVDATGGWHDAGDQLKYLMTGSYATAHMLLAFELYPERFADYVDPIRSNDS